MKKINKENLENFKTAVQMAFSFDRVESIRQNKPCSSHLKMLKESLCELYDIKEGEHVEPFYLVDAKKISENHPKTFERPLPNQFNDIKRGNLIKVCFNNIERPWLTVESVNHRTKIIKAKIESDLIFFILHGKKKGDIVELHFDNIYGIVEVKEKKTPYYEGSLGVINLN